jgi:UDP-4-amino-4,6-dideoxy-N-acetyl-beta-L-altrosamine N-acetyltransferase
MKNMRKVNLVLVTDIDTEKQVELRRIRNKPEIRKWMYTGHVISLKEHSAWVRSLKNDSSRITFAMLEFDEIIGAFNIYNINYVHKTCEWGWFIDPIKSGAGLGSAIEFHLIDFIFNNLNMVKQTVEVLEENTPVINLHKKFFFKEEGYRHSHIVKEDKRTGYYEFGLLRSDWKINKESLKHKFKNFEIEINWSQK